jgi:hypothetical protein
MNHLNKEMDARQLAGNRQELTALRSVYVNRICDLLKAGAFIQTHNNNFFMAVGLGKMNFEGMEISLLSPNASLARFFW